jgi:predicted transcriptional regulator
MTNSIAQAPIFQLPTDVHIYLVRFLPVRTIVAISSACFHFWQLYTPMVQEELSRLLFPLSGAAMRLSIRNIITVHRPPRDVFALARHFWQRTPEECRAIRNSSESQPLTIYAEFDPARVVLEEEALAARADENSLVALVNKEQDANRALVLANQIGNWFQRDETIDSVRRRTNLSPEAILTLIQMDSRLSVHSGLELISTISDKEKRDKCLQALALRFGPWGIYEKIVDPNVLIETLAKLCKKSRFPAKDVLRILKTRISDQTELDKILHHLALQNLRRESALELIDQISDKALKDLALQVRNRMDELDGKPVEEPPLKKRRTEDQEHT